MPVDVLKRNNEEDYKLVFFDYVGCGKSDITAYDPKRYGSLKGYAQDLLDVLRALEIEDTIVVAHSVSTMIALLAARAPALLVRQVAALSRTNSVRVTAARVVRAQHTTEPPCAFAISERWSCPPLRRRSSPHMAPS